MKYKYRNLLLAITLSGAMAFTGCTAANNAARVGNRPAQPAYTAGQRFSNDGTSNANRTQVAGRVDGVNINRGSGPMRQATDQRGTVHPYRSLGNYNTTGNNINTRANMGARNLDGRINNMDRYRSSNTGNMNQGRALNRAPGNAQSAGQTAGSRGTLSGAAGSSTGQYGTRGISGSQLTTRKSGAVHRQATDVQHKETVNKTAPAKTTETKKENVTKSTTKKTALKPANTAANKNTAAKSTAPKKTVTKSAAPKKAAPASTAKHQAHTAPKAQHTVHKSAASTPAHNRSTMHSGVKSTAHSGVRNTAHSSVTRNAAHSGVTRNTAHSGVTRSSTPYGVSSNTLHRAGHASPGVTNAHRSNYTPMMRGLSGAMHSAPTRSASANRGRTYSSETTREFARTQANAGARTTSRKAQGQYDTNMRLTTEAISDNRIPPQPVNPYGGNNVRAHNAKRLHTAQQRASQRNNRRSDSTAAGSTGVTRSSRINDNLNTSRSNDTVRRSSGVRHSGNPRNASRDISRNTFRNSARTNRYNNSANQDMGRNIGNTGNNNNIGGYNNAGYRNTDGFGGINNTGYRNTGGINRNSARTVNHTNRN
ncbi:MAG: hypothetical protein FWE00_11610, partial [Defluviitaleaceae bacterium]|nr:hypothetical protein [Defluviitaleaceae bacterium]